MDTSTHISLLLDLLFLFPLQLVVYPLLLYSHSFRISFLHSFPLLLVLLLLVVIQAFLDRSLLQLYHSSSYQILPAFSLTMLLLHLQILIMLVGRLCSSDCCISSMHYKMDCSFHFPYPLLSALLLYSLRICLDQIRYYLRILSISYFHPHHIHIQSFEISLYFHLHFLNFWLYSFVIRRLPNQYD